MRLLTRFIYLLVCLLFPTLVNGQYDFGLTYGLSGDDVGFALRRSHDQKYLIAGYTKSGGSGKKDGLIVKTSACGDYEWAYAIGSSDEDEFAELVSTGDKGILLVGDTDGFGLGNRKFWVTKLDSSGTMLWSKAYGSTNIEYAIGAVEVSDGYIIAGATNSFGSGDNDMLLIKITKAGNLTWSKRIHTVENDDTYDLIKDNAGNFYICGSFFAGSLRHQAFVLSINPAGQINWGRHFGFQSVDAAKSLAIDSDNNLYLFGHTYNTNNSSTDNFLLKMGLGGALQWNLIYGGSQNDYGYGLYVDAQKQVYTVGYTVGQGFGFKDILLSKIDEKGQLNYATVFGGTGNDGAVSTAHHYNIQENAFGGLTLLDNTQSFGKGGFDIGLWQTGSSKQFDCQSGNVTLQTESPFLVGTGFSPSITNVTLTESSLSPTVTPIAIETEWNCPKNEVNILGNDTTLCSADTLDIDIEVEGGRYLWNDGITTGRRKIHTAGSYWVQVDVGGCVYFDTLQVQNIPGPVFTLGKDTSLCPSETLVLEVTDTVGEIMWQDGSMNSTFTVTKPGLYSATVSYPNGCSYTDQIVVSNALPMISLGKDTTLCEGEFLRIQLPTGFTYEWNDGSIAADYTISSPGKYHVAFATGCGVAYDTLDVSYSLCDCSVYVPSAFTPNDDSYNDELLIKSTCPFREFEIRIIDRWGQTVFMSRDPEFTWSGKTAGGNALDGVFTYSIYYQFVERGIQYTELERGFITVMP